MTKKEFDQWYRDFCSAFPETSAFINIGGRPQASLQHWYEVMERAELPDALEATKRLFDGREPVIEAYERWRTPLIVKRIAEGIAANRTPRTGPLELAHEARKQCEAEGPVTWSMEEEFKRLVREREETKDVF